MTPTLPTARPVGAPTLPALSPKEAAARAKVSRRTIMRAVEAGNLPARRDNRNRWNITAEDLDRWADAQCAPSGHCPPYAHPTAHTVAPSVTQDETALELAAARATIAQLEARLEDRAALVRAAEDRTRAAEADRDRWRSVAERLAERPAPPPASPAPQPTPRPRRWWPWARG